MIKVYFHVYVSLYKQDGHQLIMITHFLVLLGHAQFSPPTVFCDAFLHCYFVILTQQDTILFYLSYYIRDVKVAQQRQVSTVENRDNVTNLSLK